MPKLKRLSLKQKGFAKDFVENKGNASKAAKSNYNVSSDNMAAVIGSKNLDNPMVQSEIEKLMEEKNIDGNLMMDKLKEGMDANVVANFQGESFQSGIPDHDKRFKWWDAAAKMMKLYPATETLNKNINIDVQLENLPKKEFTDLLKGLLLLQKKKEEKPIIIQKPKKDD
tara:strand:+ start:631 stop:1140 length:510 start_codon:yes stop_codon:yes gene_type:complete